MKLSLLTSDNWFEHLFLIFLTFECYFTCYFEHFEEKSASGVSDFHYLVAFHEELPIWWDQNYFFSCLVHLELLNFCQNFIICDFLLSIDDSNLFVSFHLNCVNDPLCFCNLNFFLGILLIKKKHNVLVLQSQRDEISQSDLTFNFIPPISALKVASEMFDRRHDVVAIHQIHHLILIFLDEIVMIDHRLDIISVFLLKLVVALPFMFFLLLDGQESRDHHFQIKIEF